VLPSSAVTVTVIVFTPTDNAQVDGVVAGAHAPGAPVIVYAAFASFSVGVTTTLLTSFATAAV
jgi:hypothetical protein